MVWRPKRNKFKWSGACTKGHDATYLYPSNTWEVGHGSRLSECVILQRGEKMVYYRVPTQASLGKMFSWDDISPKRGKYGLGPLDACHRGRWWGSLILIRMSEVKTKRGKKQNKQFCLGMESGATNTLWAEVVAGRSTSQWVVLEGWP